MSDRMAELNALIAAEDAVASRRHGHPQSAQAIKNARWLSNPQNREQKRRRHAEWQRDNRALVNEYKRQWRAGLRGAKGQC